MVDGIINSSCVRQQPNLTTPKQPKLRQAGMIRGDRIRDRLEAIGESQAALARSIGVSAQAVSKMVVGDTNESSKLFQIARFLGTTPEFLTGETDDPGLSAVADGRLAFRHAPMERDPDLIEVPQIDLRYGLGGTYVDGPVVEEKRVFSRKLLRHLTSAAPENLFWALGDGDSMEPTIRSGELILIDRSQVTPRSGDGIWAFAWGDIGMIKRLRPLPDGSVEIHSDNPAVRPATASDSEVHVVGRVAAVVRRL
jgi:SOS-response transcriptional repressor LexA